MRSPEASRCLQESHGVLVSHYVADFYLKKPREAWKLLGIDVGVKDPLFIAAAPHRLRCVYAMMAVFDRREVESK